MGSLSGFGWFFNTYLIGYLRISCLTGSFATYFTGSLAGDFAASLTSIWPGSCFTGYLTANLIGSLVASLGVSCLAYFIGYLMGYFTTNFIASLGDSCLMWSCLDGYFANSFIFYLPTTLAGYLFASFGRSWLTNYFIDYLDDYFAIYLTPSLINYFFY